MNSPPIPPLHDFVRAYAPTEDETVRRLLDHYERPPTPWSYAPARSVAQPAFAHDAPFSALIRGMLTSGSPAGRKQNAEAVDHIWQAGQGRSIRCQPLPPRQIALRRDVSVRVPVDFRFTEERKPHVFWVQPRRGFAFNRLGLRVLGSIFRMTYLVDELESAGVEILDLSAPTGGRRVHTVYRLPDLPTISDDEVTAILQQVVSAYDAICAMGRNWDAEARARRGAKPPPPPAPGLFG